MDFVQAKWFHTGRQGKAIRLFVVHDAEAPEKATTAEAVARYFHTTDRKASAHYVTDSDSSVQCVRDADTAFGAAGANNDGLHFEQVGYAKQTEAEWLDPYGLAMLEQLGTLLRAKAAEHVVPLEWLTVDQVRDGKTRGLCTHADVSKAFPAVSTGHTDPGPNYPKARALAIWRRLPIPDPEEPLVPTGYSLVFVTDGPDRPWWLTDGMTRRGPIQGSSGDDPSDAQELFDIGLNIPPDEKHPNRPRAAKVISPQFLASIPVAK